MSNNNRIILIYGRIHRLASHAHLLSGTPPDSQPFPPVQNVLSYLQQGRGGLLVITHTRDSKSHCFDEPKLFRSILSHGSFF